MKTANLSRVIPVLAVTVSCVALSILLLPLRPYLDKSVWGLVYTLLVVVTANRWGIASGVSAATVSFFSWNFFFLPPYGTLHLANTEDWLSLSIFLVVAVVIGLQTGHVQQQQRLLTRQIQQTNLLNRIGSQLVSDSSITQVANLVTGEVQQLTGVRFCHLYRIGEDGVTQIFPSSAAESQDTVSALVDEAMGQAKAVVVGYQKLPSSKTEQCPVFVDAPLQLRHFTHEIAIPLATPERLLGSIHLGPRDDNEELGQEAIDLVVGIANLAASFFERELLKERAFEAQSLRDADHLKQTFISAVSHELKTPVSAIQAIVSNLAKDDVDWSPGMVQQELAAISDSTDRLSRSITYLLEYSRLETSSWQTVKEYWQVGEILSHCLDAVPDALRHRLKVSIPEDIPEVQADFSQLVRAVNLVLENAMEYSAGDSEVSITVSQSALSVTISVADQGQGIPDNEKDRVFDKFYRGASGRKIISGTGLGLTIALQILQNHNGRIEITDNNPQGTVIHLVLPKHKQAN